MRLSALFRLAFATAPPIYGLTLPHPVTRRLIKQKARGHPETGLLRPHMAPTACKHTVSGSISLPSLGFFSPFPHGTSSLSVASEYLALPDGPGRFPQGFTCPAVLRSHLKLRLHFKIQGCHLLWCAVPGISAKHLVCDSMWPSPTTPVRPKPVRFGLIRVRSPLLTESLLFSLPRGTEMVHFPRFALPAL